MQTLVAILIDGLIYASWLFIVATGLTLVFGIMRILNLAHGSFYAIGAYTAASLIGWYFAQDLPPYLSYVFFVAIALGVGLLVGALIERGVLRFLYGRDEVTMLLATFALLLILEDVMKLIWGASPYFAFQPYSLLGRTSLAGLPYTRYDLCLILVGALLAVLLWWGLNRTRFGKLVRAVIHDPEVSYALGINVSRVFVITFAFGAMLGALAGAITAPRTSVVPGIGVEVIVVAFAVVVTGGLGSVGGALVGALLVGLARAAAVHLLPEVELFVIYAVMTAVLVFRPQGLFGQKAARKI